MVLGRCKFSGPLLESSGTKCVEKSTVTKWRLSRLNPTEYPATDIGSHPSRALAACRFQMRIAPLVGSCVHAQMSNLQDSLGRLLITPRRLSRGISRGSHPPFQPGGSANLLAESAQATLGRQVRVRLSLEYQVMATSPCYPGRLAPAQQTREDDIGSTALERLDQSDLRRGTP